MKTIPPALCLALFGSFTVNAADGKGSLLKVELNGETVQDISLEEQTPEAIRPIRQANPAS